MASEEDPPPDDKKYKVIIVGAGIAGLSAANLLVKNNITDFIVLESRDRLGGRIVSLDAGGTRLELGANWIHGVLGNPIYEMAMSNGLVDIVHVPKPHRVVASMENGKQVPFPLLQEVYEAYMCFVHRCEEYFLCEYAPPAGVESVGEHLELEIALYLERIGGSPEEQRVRRLVFDCLLKRETCISGCSSMDEIDLLEVGSYTELQGGNMTLPAGYASLVSIMARALPPTSLLLQQRVTLVEYSREKASSDRTFTGEEDEDEPESDESEVKITTSSGQTYVAQSAIITLPLGVLKAEHKALFSPQLPLRKSMAIDRLLFGTVDKIFLVYDRPFLNPDISELMLLWERSTDRGEEISEVWYKKIYSFSKVSETVLLGWISGREAEYMETLPEQEVSERCTSVLRQFLNDPFVPKPKSCIRTHWHNEPNTRGSYTSIAVGASQTDIETLGEPMYADAEQTKPLILFAGEHVHSSFYSTVHGAYLTGRAAAQAVLDRDEPQGLDPASSDLSSWLRGISLDGAT